MKMDFNNPSGSGIRSPFSPRVRLAITGRRPISMSTIKKNQSKYMHAPENSGEVIYKTSHHTIETFGAPLPVMVTEALTFASGRVTVRMSECGWCWAVCGRRVLCWPISTSGTASRELLLPQTDLAHKADLVMLYHHGDAQIPSCVGVSPEGTVRYWPSVGQEGVFVERSCDLQGQECDRLGETGLVLATTTCTVVVITATPEDSDGRPSVSCRTLRPPSGWLGGLGRRVSLLIFGSMSSAAVDARLVGVVVLEEAGLVALVARGPVLQLWAAADLHEHDLRRPLAAAHPDMGNAEVTCLDVRAGGPRGLLLLLAGTDLARDPHLRYALAHVSVEDPTAPRVTALTMGVFRHSEADPRVRLLALGPRALLYTSGGLAVVGGRTEEDPEAVDVAAEGDRILGADVCGGRALLFSAKHGVMRLIPHHAPHDRSVCESPPTSPCPSDVYDGNLSLYEIDPHEVNAVTTDACGKLKTAFLFHLRRDAGSCRALLEELFPAPGPDPDGALDATVLRIAREMADDMPAGDPRWRRPQAALGTDVPLGGSAALQISTQLADKRRALALFADFLRAVGLWGRLEGGSARGELAQLPEKIAAALALRRLRRTALGPVVDRAVSRVAAEGREEPEVEAGLASGALSPSDVCYRRVTGIGRVLVALARQEPDRGEDDAEHAHRVAHAVTTVMAEVHECRRRRSREPAVRTWTGEPGADGPLSALVHLHERLFGDATRKCSDGRLRAQIHERAVSLAHVILSEAQHLASSARTRPTLDRLRKDLIRPFVEERQYERAAALAEAFEEFDLLIEMCVRADDFDKLFAYIDKYIEQGLAETAFGWLWERGGSGRARLVRRLGARYPDRLRVWLGAVGSRVPLLALHELGSGRHLAAGLTLTELAVSERDDLDRMKSMASLAKLCALCSEGEGGEEGEAARARVYRGSGGRLALAEQQEALPRELRVHHGLEGGGGRRVLSPERLVEVYTSAECRSLTEHDYLKALELTELVEDPERRDDLRLRVWCAAVRRDDWTRCEDPLRDTTFFRLVELVQMSDGDLELLLPPLEDVLTAPELADLLTDNVHYAIKYGYECLYTPQRDRDLND